MRHKNSVLCLLACSSSCIISLYFKTNMIMTKPSSSVLFVYSVLQSCVKTRFHDLRAGFTMSNGISPIRTPRTGGCEWNHPALGVVWRSISQNSWLKWIKFLPRLFEINWINKLRQKNLCAWSGGWKCYVMTSIECCNDNLENRESSNKRKDLPKKIPPYNKKEWLRITNSSNPPSLNDARTNTT